MLHVSLLYLNNIVFYFLALNVLYYIEHVPIEVNVIRLDYTILLFTCIHIYMP